MVQKDYYELLGVPRGATEGEIRLAFRDLERIYSPGSEFFRDLIDTPLSPEQRELFDHITAAFATLIDPAKRAAYDEELPAYCRVTPPPEENELIKLSADTAPPTFAQPLSPASPAVEDGGDLMTQRRWSSAAHDSLGQILRAQREGAPDPLLLIFGLGLPVLSAAAVAVIILLR